MTRNLGPEDRIGRIAVAIGLGILVYVGALNGTAAIVAGVVAVYLAVTGLIAYCLIYPLIGIDTSVQEQSYTKPDDQIDF
jgi:hypothetical protein